MVRHIRDMLVPLCMPLLKMTASVVMPLIRPVVR